MWIFVATAMSKTQAAQEQLKSKAQRREKLSLITPRHHKANENGKKESSKEAFLDKSYSRGKNWFLPSKCKQTEEKLCIQSSAAATVQPICYMLRHYPRVSPKQAWGQPSALFLLPRCQQGHHTCPTAPLSTPGHGATDGNRRLQWRWERHHQLLLLSFRAEGAAKRFCPSLWVPSPPRAQPETFYVPLYPKTWTAVHHKICNSWMVDAWGPKTRLNLFLCSTKSWHTKGIVKCFQNDHCFFC